MTQNSSDSLDLAHTKYIEEGLADIRAGNTVAHEEVVAWLNSWGTDEERDPP